MSPMAMAQSFYDGVVVRYVLPVLWMSYFHIMGLVGGMKHSVI